MAVSHNEMKVNKKVFVTVGTTKFDDLIETVLSTNVLLALSSRGYDEIRLQIGQTHIKPDCTPRHGFVNITWFNLDPNILDYVHAADLVISHAGAGSIMDALESKKPLIVVANQQLMGNHQLELAEQLHNDEYLYYCICKTLLTTIQTMDLSKLKVFENKKSKNIAKFIDNIMGF